jgi:hypothetical protein
LKTPGNSRRTTSAACSTINRMWLEKMPVPSIIAAARSLASAMEKYA